MLEEFGEEYASFRRRVGAVLPFRALLPARKNTRFDSSEDRIL
jgi:hypothetical protein